MSVKVYVYPTQLSWATKCFCYYHTTKVNVIIHFIACLKSERPIASQWTHNIADENNGAMKTPLEKNAWLIIVMRANVTTTKEK